MVIRHNLTLWLSDEDPLENERIDRLAGLYELDRTRDDTDVDLFLTDVDIKHEYAPAPCEGH